MPKGVKGFEKGKSGNARGRPKGAKGATTIFKEALVQGAEDIMVKQIKKITQVVCEKAAEGDMTAAKMVFDRLLPTTKAIDIKDLGSKGMGITINIENLQTNRPSSEVEGDYVEIEHEDTEK